MQYLPSHRTIISMKLAVLVSFLLCFACSGISAQDKSRETFVLVREEPPVFIYERWIIFPESNPPVEAREVKCVFDITGSIYDLLPLLKTEANVKVWQTHVESFTFFPKPDTTMWQEYSYHDIPWPVSDQDHFLEYHITEPKKGEQLFISFKSKADDKLAPKKKGVTRMILSGSWTVDKIAPNQSRITYRILSMPIGIPRLFTDPVIRSNLMSTIHALMKLAEEKNQ